MNINTNSKIFMLICAIIIVFALSSMHVNRLEGFTTKDKNTDTDKDNKKQDYCKALSQYENGIGAGIGAAGLGAGGKMGPQGPPGPSGGAYILRGKLQNASLPGQTMSRMYGKGAFAYPYMEKMANTPQQFWQLSDKNKLENDYGDCLTYQQDPNNKELVNVYMNSCTAKMKQGEDQGWVYNKSKQTIMPLKKLTDKNNNHINMCLAVDNPMAIPTAKIIGADGKSSLASGKQITKVSLENCVAGDTTQQWFM